MIGRLRGRRSRTPHNAHEPLHLDDIQGNILHGYRAEAAAYIFLQVHDPVAAAACIAETADLVTTALRRPGAVALNVGVTYAGLAALGVPAHRLAGLPQAFKDGMAARAVSKLGDTGAHAPLHWDDPFRPGTPLHGVAILHGEADAVAERLRRIRAELWQDGFVEVCPPLLTGRLRGGREHFGYVDGLTQATVSEAPGQFILGAPDLDGVADTPYPALLTNGSYLVVRKLGQDVAGFRERITEAARLTGTDPEYVAAKVMGRWRDGTPVAQSPGRGSSQEEFTYDDDPAGDRCPIGAHVRRANPRGSLLFDGRLEHRHRLLRRGMPYGPPMPGFEDGSGSGSWEPVDDGQERGLLFACYQADIEAQFEFVQSQWLGDGNVFGLGYDRDPIVGHPTGEPGRPGEPGDDTVNLGGATFVPAMRTTVTTRGGAYFLVPGVEALRHLAAVALAAGAEAGATAEVGS